MKTLFDILACPCCKRTLTLSNQELSCEQCEKEFPLVDGVPVFTGIAQSMRHETVARANYDDYLVKPILRTLDRSHIVLDVGSGNMKLDHPNIIRVENSLSSFVDVVADAEHLPFKECVADLIFSTALIEHLPDPFAYSSEAQRVSRLGGYCYAETNFLWPWHAHPDHYFNFSVSGIDKVFAGFRKIRSGVPAHGYPPFTLAVVVDQFLKYFAPTTENDQKLVRALRSLQELVPHPLQDFEFARGFDYEGAKVLASVVYYFGTNRPNGESIIPAPIVEAVRRDSKLRERYPNPYDLLESTNPWLELRHKVDLAAYYSGRELFGKRGENPGRIEEPILE